MDTAALLNSEPAKAAAIALDAFIALIAGQHGDKGAEALATLRQDGIPAQLVDATREFVEEYLKWGKY